MAKRKIKISMQLLDNLAGAKGASASGAPSQATMNRVAIAVNKKVVAPLAHEYVLDNFLVGGRPRFEANSKNWRNWKAKHGYPTRPLWMTGDLFKKAILDPVIKVTADSVVLSPRSPTSLLKKTMNRLHDGGGGIPARPWTVLLPSQNERIKKVRMLAWKSVIAEYAVTGRMNY